MRAMLQISFLWIELLAAPAVQAESPCPAPRTLTETRLATIPRSAPGFTEGLFYRRGWLFESTGTYQTPSTINRIDPITGEVMPLMRTPGGAFGEGIVAWREEILQLTYRDREIFVYEMPSVQWRASLPSPLAEGWGLTTDGNRLILSDGSNRLYFADPETLALQGLVIVHDESGREFERLNELEYVNGLVYANEFLTQNVLAIDPLTGCVRGIWDLSGLYGELTPEEKAYVLGDSNFVPNGIAYDSEDGSFFVTGKNWPKLFKVKIR